MGAASAERGPGSGYPRSLNAGFLSLGFCIHTLKLALPRGIQGKSRMRQRARTDLCGGRSAMVVPTAPLTSTIRGVPKPNRS
jgi:hypothetical protein